MLPLPDMFRTFRAAARPLARPLSRPFSSAPAIVLSTPTVLISTLPVTPVQMNQYLVGCRATNTAALIDCGDDDPSRWISHAAENGMDITKILQTHGHVDHVAGLAQTVELLNVPIHACSKDWAIFKSAPVQGLMFGITCPSPPPIDVDVHDGDIIEVGNLRFEVLFTPGHSPGHLCFLERAENVLIAGDLLFQGSIGRTDLPGCSWEDMEKSLARVAKLGEDVVVFPGHMGTTTIGEELRHNPYLKA